MSDQQQPSAHGLSIPPPLPTDKHVDSQEEHMPSACWPPRALQPAVHLVTVYSHCQGVWGRMAKRKHNVCPERSCLLPRSRPSNALTTMWHGASGQRRQASRTNPFAAELVFGKLPCMEGLAIMERSEARYRSDPLEGCSVVGRPDVSTGREPSTPNAVCCTTLRDLRQTRCQGLQVRSDAPGRHLDLECRARSRLTPLTERPLGRTFSSPPLACQDIACVPPSPAVCVVDARSRKAKVAPHTPPHGCVPCLRSCMCDPCRVTLVRNWQGKFCRCPAPLISSQRTR
jgi:hypothetical protein